MSIPNAFSKKAPYRLLFLSTIFGLGLIWLLAPFNGAGDRFCFQSLAKSKQYRSDWEVHPLTPEETADLKKALDQNYRYLACGQQAFAFVSNDGNYVLKFLKKKQFETHRFWDQKKQWERRNKQERDFASYRLAFDALQHETGLVFVHLNPSSDLPSKLNVADAKGKVHSLNLNKLNFILQRRAELVYPTIDRLMEQGAVDEAKQALRSLLTLFANRIQKGIADSDPDLDKNFGFIEGKAIQIDVGRFTDRPQITHYRNRDKEVEKAFFQVPFPPIKESFWEWLLAHHPLLYDDFKKAVEEAAI